ncbi:hypothetical protein ACEQ8H_003744 [Pleosporales sp. CAS-2024a]
MSPNPPLSRSPLVSAAAHSPPSPALDDVDDPPDKAPPEHDDARHVHDEDDMPYPEPSSAQMLLPPPTFKPFFTLIEDETSGEHYHPYVHYIFADDDPAIIAAASMRSLGLDDTKYMAHPAHPDAEPPPASERTSEHGQDALIDSPLPPPIPGLREHYVIVDLAADGRTVVNAQSLSPEWQVTHKSLRIAPSFDETSPDQGYMLRIQGIEIPTKSKAKAKALTGKDRLSEAREKAPEDIFAALDSLVQDIERGLATAAHITGIAPVVQDGAVSHVRPTEEDQIRPSET